MANFQK